MSRTALLLTSAAATAALAVAAPVASAATTTQPNVCYSQDGGAPQYGNLPLQLTPASATPNGRQLDVGAIQPDVTIPSWLKDKLNSAGAGVALGSSKTIPVQAWMALAGDGSTDGAKVVTTSGSVRVSVGGGLIPSVTGVSVTLNASGATSWHATDAGGTLSVAQAGPGSLASVAELGGKPKGSLFIKGSFSALGQTVNLSIDCQPGTNGSDDPASLTSTLAPGSSLALASSVFAAVQAAVPTAPVSTPAPVTTPAPVAAPTPKPAAPSAPLSAGTLAIASASLKFGSAAVLVSVSCPAGGPDCTGTIALTSAKKLKVGKGAAKVRKLAAGTYAVKAGTSVPVKLKLSSDGKKLRKTALVAKVVLTPAKGAAIAKNLRANG